MPTKKKSSVPVLPEGMFDIIPSNQKYWHFLWRRANGLLSDYSFSRVDLAPVESAEVFARSVAQSNPDAGKQQALVKWHGASLALRSSLPQSLVRVYLQYGMHTEPSPVKLFSTSPIAVPSDRGHHMHYQLGVQTTGDAGEAVDAELLFLGCRILESLNMGSFVVRLNTVGDLPSKQTYMRALRDFLRVNQKKLSTKVVALVKEHPFRALAQLAQEDAELAKEAPQSVEHLSDEARGHFKRLLEFLDEGQVPYMIDHTLLTTDDYATHTVWEFILNTDTQVSTGGIVVIRGGRMDRMSELLGGPKTPSAGWTLDVDTLVKLMEAKNLNVPDIGAKPKVFLSQLGEAAKRRSLMLFEEIRKSGIEVRYSLSRDNIKGQLRMAERLGVRFALIFGQKEALEGTVMVRELETGIQETIPLEKIIDELKKRLKAK